jgi:hypothetical protein
MIKTIISKETSQTEMVAGSRPNEWGKREECKM